MSWKLGADSPRGALQLCQQCLRPSHALRSVPLRLPVHRKPSGFESQFSIGQFLPLSLLV